MVRIFALIWSHRITSFFLFDSSLFMLYFSCACFGFWIIFTLKLCKELFDWLDAKLSFVIISYEFSKSVCQWFLTVSKLCNAFGILQAMLQAQWLDVSLDEWCNIIQVRFYFSQVSMVRSIYYSIVVIRFPVRKYFIVIIMDNFQLLIEVLCKWRIPGRVFHQIKNFNSNSKSRHSWRHWLVPYT